MTTRIDPPQSAAPEALPGIARLLERTIPRGRPWLPDLDWLYLQNPAGPAWYVNARSDTGDVIAHFAVVPCPPLDDPRFDLARTFFALNVAVRPDAGIPGLMVAVARALFRHLEAQGPVVFLGVGNENSFVGLSKLLGFRPLGRLQLRFYPPFGLPRGGPLRVLRLDGEVLRWRVGRPDADMFARPARGAVLRRIHHHGLPLDAVLTVGLPGEVVAALGLPAEPRSRMPLAPRLYAGFGARSPGGVPVPERLRPSPLEFVFRPGAPGINGDTLGAFLSSRRFEFLDFDVV